MKTINIVCLVWLCSFFAQAQPAATTSLTKQEMIAAYQKVCGWFISTTNYSFKIRYTSYKDHFSKNQVDNSEGFYKRVAASYLTEAVGIKTIQNPSLKVVIDNEDKIITVMDAGNLSPAIANVAELETLLDNANSLKKTKQAKSTMYHIGFNKGGTVEAYEFTVSDKGLLETITYYYAEQVQKADKYENPSAADIKMKPRLEISFFNYEMPVKYTDYEFSEQDIITRNKNKISLTAPYKDYRLQDYRLQTKK